MPLSLAVLSLFVALAIPTAAHANPISNQITTLTHGGQALTIDLPENPTPVTDPAFILETYFNPESGSRVLTIAHIAPTPEQSSLSPLGKACHLGSRVEQIKTGRDVPSQPSRRAVIRDLGSVSCRQHDRSGANGTWAPSSYRVNSG